MDSNIVVTQFTSAAIFVWAMQKLKAAPWFPWLKREGQLWLKRGASIAAAIGAHTGISHVWAPGPASIPGSHMLVFTIPPAAVIAVTVWHWIGQYAIQETIYQGVSNRSPAAIDSTPAKG
jgi:hypothetical protein